MRTTKWGIRSQTALHIISSDEKKPFGFVKSFVSAERFAGQFLAVNCRAAPKSLADGAYQYNHGNKCWIGIISNWIVWRWTQNKELWSSPGLAAAVRCQRTATRCSKINQDWWIWKHLFNYLLQWQPEPPVVAVLIPSLAKSLQGQDPPIGFHCDHNFECVNTRQPALSQIIAKSIRPLFLHGAWKDLKNRSGIILFF